MTEAGEDEAVFDEDEEVYELPLSEEARYEVQLGTTFTYRGTSHWPKLVVTDSMMSFQDASGEYTLEGAESLTYRVEQIAHLGLDRLVARMKRDIDTRYAVDAAARTSAHQAAAAAHDTEDGETT